MLEHVSGNPAFLRAAAKPSGKLAVARTNYRFLGWDRVENGESGNHFFANAPSD